MQTTNWLSSMPVSCWILLAAVGLAGAAPQDLDDLYYEMTYDSRSTVDFEDPARADREEATHNRYWYVLKRGEKGIRAFLLGMSVNPTFNGRPTGGAMLLTTERYLDNAMEEYRAKAPPEIVKIFADSFDSPAATFDRERKGFLPAGSHPPDAIGGHLKVFHAPFAAKEASWAAFARVPLVMADGVEGELTCSRVEERGDRVSVRVSGDLTRPTGEFAKVAKNLKMQVTGNQEYDRRRGEWMSGDMNLSLSGELVVEEKRIAAWKSATRYRLKPADRQSVLTAMRAAGRPSAWEGFPPGSWVILKRANAKEKIEIVGTGGMRACYEERAGVFVKDRTEAQVVRSEPLARGLKEISH